MLLVMSKIYEIQCGGAGQYTTHTNLHKCRACSVCLVHCHIIYYKFKTRFQFVLFVCCFLGGASGSCILQHGMDDTVECNFLREAQINHHYSREWSTLYYSSSKTIKIEIIYIVHSFRVVVILFGLYHKWDKHFKNVLQEICVSQGQRKSFIIVRTCTPVYKLEIRPGGQKRQDKWYIIGQQLTAPHQMTGSGVGEICVFRGKTGSFAFSGQSTPHIHKVKCKSCK